MSDRSNASRVSDSRPSQVEAGHGDRLVMIRNASVTFLLIAIGNKIVASASTVYRRRFRIGIMEWRVMALLAAEPGITAQDISWSSGVTPGSVSRAIQGLKRRGLLESKSDDADNRRSFLRLTRNGMELHNRVIIASLRREQLLLTGFSQAEHGKLLKFLQRLSVNVALVDAYDPDGGL